MALKFDTSFDPVYGQGVSVAPDVQRITARNPSPFTFHGTNSYIVGRDTLAVIDPGPDDEAHLQTLLDVIAGRPVSHIFVSHTHRDHSPLAARLKERTGAVVLAEGPHRPARPLHIGETNALDASADMAFVPDIALPDDRVIDGDGWSIRTVLTPGHTANHAAFALEGTGILFSADHVMAWATSIVAPPDGAMADYMASLDRLIERGDRLLLPGHGGPVTAAARFHARVEDASQDARARHPGAGQSRRPDDRRHGQGDLSRHRSAAAWRCRIVGACPSGGSGGARSGHDGRRTGHRRHFHARSTLRVANKGHTPILVYIRI